MEPSSKEAPRNYHTLLLSPSHVAFSPLRPRKKCGCLEGILRLSATLPTRSRTVTGVWGPWRQASWGEAGLKTHARHCLFCSSSQSLSHLDVNLQCQDSQSIKKSKVWEASENPLNLVITGLSKCPISRQWQKGAVSPAGIQGHSPWHQREGTSARLMTTSRESPPKGASWTLTATRRSQERGGNHRARHSTVRDPQLQQNRGSGRLSRHLGKSVV